jgi:uncharacterized membrane protein YccC
MDRLTAQATQHAERHSERKAFNDVTAMGQALQRAIARQPNASTQQPEAHHGPHTTAQTPKGNRDDPAGR